MQSLIVIPARYASTRFPGKPLTLIKGRTMLERTWQIARASGADRVVVATDDDRIEEACRSFSADVVRTDPACANGTERVHQALERMGSPAEVVLNLQGDAVLTPPWVLTALLDVMKADSLVPMATPAVRISADQYRQLKSQKDSGIVGGTMVVFDRQYNALYFSKAMIPFLRSTGGGDPPLYRHIGLYAYRRDTLERYLSLEPGELEKTEGLEQLRALENGIGIRVVVVDYRGRTHGSVDSETDVPVVEAIIESEGELVPQPLPVQQ
ncbi:MAG: 3-deoxy-manno-octulosonate cytidylyltransferase [Candidatus Melainabacteria bacterium]|nr:3-deoxy-manno-octulosonate cytidylyltransferase [Candidatus Melainabacteria bacterium]